MALAVTPDITSVRPDGTYDNEGEKGLEIYPAEQPEFEENGYITITHLRNLASPGWSMHVHPRGFIYWFNAHAKVVVDDDIRMPDLLERANAFCTQCEQLNLSEGIEVHMTGGVQDSSLCLFVNHTQCVGAYDLAKVRNDVIRDLGVDGLVRARKSYWKYIKEHPSHRPCPQWGFNDAIDALRTYTYEHIYRGSSCMAPFSKSECEELLDILLRTQDEGRDLPSTAALLGWILQDVYTFRIANRYGRVTRDQLKAFRELVAKPPEFAPQQSTATRLLILFLIHIPFFGIPQTYLAHVKNANRIRGHVAGLKESWEAYTVQLVKEYSDFILVATVLLSATVGLLTIDGLSEASRAAALLSAFAALGSMTVGVFLVWGHQRNTRILSSFSYLHNARNNALGISGHALLLSLPPVLLVWSIIGFAVAALLYALQDTARASTWVMFALFLVTLAAVMGGVYTFSTIWQWHSKGSWWRGFILCRRNGRRGAQPDV